MTGSEDLFQTGKNTPWKCSIFTSLNESFQSFLHNQFNCVVLSPIESSAEWFVVYPRIFTLQACIREEKFLVCDQISPIPDGKLLLNYIRDTKFTSQYSFFTSLLVESFIIRILRCFSLSNLQKN